MVMARLKTVVHPDEMKQKVGKILTPDDVNIILKGMPVGLDKPDGRPLLRYLPGAFSHEYIGSYYDTLHSLKKYETNNRGLASGTERVKLNEAGTRTYSAPVSSVIVGAMDAVAPTFRCRLTAWSGKEVEEFESLLPLFADIGRYFKEYVPDRFTAQLAEIYKTKPDWVIKGSPFTTVTVNNSYPTGVHTDKGDLDEGFSTLAVLRRGHYSGGVLTFPEYRVGVDMQDGDLLLMDAHDWHGNTAMQCGDCGELMGPGGGEHVGCTAERISIVSYYRTDMKNCGTPEEEHQKSLERIDKFSGLQEPVGAQGG
jgi:hypothetical protein